MTALMLLGTPGLALAGAEGVWTFGNPRACYEGSEDVMVVHRDRFVHHENSCAFGGRAPRGFRSVSGTMQCTSEGEDYVSDVRLDAKGDKLRMNGGGAISVWQRCRGTQALSAPVVNRAETAQTVANAAAIVLMLGVLGKALDENN